MSGSNPFENIFPSLLESSVQEVGELIGGRLEVADTAASQGTQADVFKSPKKKFVLAGFKLKGESEDRLHLIMELDAAIELAGRLIMLPAEEIKAAKKQGKLEGEMLDACSEIVNIITGTINTAFYEAFAQKKRHFIKGQIQVHPPGTGDLPLSSGLQSRFSGQLALKGEKLGLFQFFLPHDLVADPETAAEQPESAAASAESKEAEAPEKQAAPAQEAPEAPGTDPELVDALLHQGLDTAREELEALLGDAVSFTDPQIGHRKKAELLSKTRGKQVLTRIQAAGETEGQVFMLLPVKDAIYFGGVLLMMPADSIAETVKQGKFDGEVADAFGEVANILVSCYSNQFQGGAPLKLKLKKESVETLVPAQVDPAGDEPFSSRHYYVVSAGIQMGEKSYGPLELLFPAELLGLRLQAAGQNQQPAAPGQKSVQEQEAGQKIDRGSQPSSAENTPRERIISVVGGEPEDVKAVENSITDEDVGIARFSLDIDLKQALGGENPNCVFLFISRVNEQGLAKTIMVRSALKKECPLIVAGPQWTRSSVLKARKYGATDILATPAETEVIRKKYRKYL